MQDRIDRANWPSPRGPWHEVTDVSRIYDFGMPWCVYAAGHPDPSGDAYPDPLVHPESECRTAGLYLDGVRFDLDGLSCGLQVYAARPFTFGAPRASAERLRTAIIFDVFENAASSSSIRFSLSAEALVLARGA
jgi:hypothetical protein